MDKGTVCDTPRAFQESGENSITDEICNNTKDVTLNLLPEKSKTYDLQYNLFRNCCASKKIKI